MVFDERVLSTLATAAPAGATTSNFSSSSPSRSLAALRFLKQKKIKEPIMANARMMPMATPAFAPPVMPPSVAGTAVAVLVCDKVGIIDWLLVSEATRRTESGVSVSVGRMTDGIKVVGAEDDATERGVPLAATAEVTARAAEELACVGVGVVATLGAFVVTGLGFSEVVVGFAV